MPALVGRHEKKMKRFTERQARLAELAYAIAPMAGKSLDDNDVRTILAAIVRRWTTTVEAVYMSDAVRGGAPAVIEHVVPVRVLVDRMIRYPRTSKRLLRTCVVVAKLTPPEHAKIGSLAGTHAQLYEEMKGCLLDDLVALAWMRYRRQGVVVTDAEGRKPWSARRS